MATYLQMYLDETSEQLDALVETLLALEGNPTHAGQLNEAFRLIHSIKGSSAMMGLDSITVLTHHLENHFERIRSGLQSLDRPMMDLVLRCIDFLKECNSRLRSGQALASAPELLEELGRHVAVPRTTVPPQPSAATREVAAHESTTPEPVARATAESAAPTPSLSSESNAAESTKQGGRKEAGASQFWRVTVRFEPGLQLADLKAELVLSRLSDLGEIRQTDPPRGELVTVADVRRLQVVLHSDRSAAEIRGAADVGGVDLVEMDRSSQELELDASILTEAEVTESTDEPAAHPVGILGPTGTSREIDDTATGRQGAVSPHDQASHEEKPARVEPVPAAPDAAETRSRVVETVRVDIDRLDNLLNLAGELVVTNARFVQISRQMGPAFKKTGRARAFGETIRRLIETLKLQRGSESELRRNEWTQQLMELEAEIDAVESQARLWEEGRRCFGQINEAVNQLTRVSDSLQRGVLDTRMVPVGPLFNRFKRVVRDISQELNKQVSLEIQGEKTELDKRMIDELGDPLVHLVRNAIDHGLESAEQRVARGKPAEGTLKLEAVHSGNNVYIHVRDDGGGINAAKIRERIVSRGLVAAEIASQLSDADVIEYIWHPGFSTADVVSDISGRGVGMDIVKTRIAELNGTITVETELGKGTSISIRLPLTLAIIRCLLFRLRHGMFAVPIDGVREIVSVPFDEIVTIHGRHTFEVRGEFLPLVDIDDVFDWPEPGIGGEPASVPRESRSCNVVILQNANETIGLRVDELHGGQDIVIKSLAENFVHIRGLSGASILGDGSVCLLLDVAAAIDLAVRGRGLPAHRELASCP